MYYNPKQVKSQPLFKIFLLICRTIIKLMFFSLQTNKNNAKIKRIYVLGE